jgi:hemoglobin-like flavoprotein
MMRSGLFRESMMKASEIDLIQQSWNKVVPMADQVAALFYGRLFELDPQLKPLFTGDMKSQGRKLTAMINTVVVNLGNLGALVPAVEGLGRRHVGYGVKPEHYESVGAALLWTLAQGIGDSFTPETEKAWTEAYTILADVMRSAAAKCDAVQAALPA